MAKPQSPHEHLQQLDQKGDAYWIRLFSYQNAQRDIGKDIVVTAMGDMTVCNHGPEWVELSAGITTSQCFPKMTNATFWMRWSDLGPFQICEEGD